MKLIRNKTPEPKPEDSLIFKTNIVERVRQNQSIPVTNPSVWKILVVDDEPEVHAVTKLSVGNLIFADKPIQLLNAMSAAEAKEIFAKEPDIAVAMIDVVMETEDAGLRLVDYIRNELGNQRIRLIIRTGQPGAAPERQVIDNYDIDDYKDKTELTAQRLYTTLRTTLKSYRDLSIIDTNRLGLEKILTAAPDIYRIQPMEQFIEGILTQITSLCNIGNHNLVATINGFLAVPTEDSKGVIRAGTGKFAKSHSSEVDAIIQTCEPILKNGNPIDTLPENSLLLPMKVHDKVLGFIFLEEIGFLAENDRALIKIMASQCAAALENIQLYMNLEKAKQQNEQKNYFLGMAAHDLRNPLGIITGYGDLLSRKIANYPNGGEPKFFLHQIKNQADFMLDLVTNLLDVAKIESGQLQLQPQLTDLISLISKSVFLNRSLAETKQIELELSCDDNIPQMNVDENRIIQVINNLLSNSIKYSHPKTKVQVYLSENKNDVIISVKDEGQGIPAKELNKLFKPFSKTSVMGTAHETSTGLGLLICKQIVEAHKGKIWVESEVDVGSSFHVSLPK